MSTNVVTIRRVMHPSYQRAFDNKRECLDKQEAENAQKVEESLDEIFQHMRRLHKTMRDGSASEDEAYDVFWRATRETLHKRFVSEPHFAGLSEMLESGAHFPPDVSPVPRSNNNQ